MTTASFDMTESIAPRSDQLNSEDLLSGPRTVTIVDVRQGSAEQPVDIVTAEFGPGRPYKPSKTMRRMIVAAYGKDSGAYIGKRLTLYRDPDVTFGKDKVGGIKISHMSDIPKQLSIALTVKRGQKGKFTADPLPDDPTPAPSDPFARMLAAFADLGVTEQQVTSKLGKPRAEWGDAEMDALKALGGAIKRGEQTVADAFPSDQSDTEEDRA